MPRKLSVFNHISLDGFFVDVHGDMSWAHVKDPEWDAFVEGNSAGGGELVFGRVTYEMMAGFWPSPMAAQMMPAVAENMNKTPKIVVSRSLEAAAWNNTRLVRDLDGVRAVKAEDGPGMVVLGSGNLVSQLAAAGLIDEYQLVMSPIVLGKGRTLFETVGGALRLKHQRSRTFENGRVFVAYTPAG